MRIPFPYQTGPLTKREEKLSGHGARVRSEEGGEEKWGRGRRGNERKIIKHWIAWNLWAKFWLKFWPKLK
jgi:hypothetical protein